MDHKQAFSFGVIPLFKGGDNYKLAIVQNSKGGHWGLPKGTPEGTETPRETALRELNEETGITDIQIESEPIFQEKYTFEYEGVMYDKTNTYFIGYVPSMDIGTELDEIVEMRWVTFEEARQVLTHKQVIQTVSKLEEYLKIKKF